MTRHLHEPANALLYRALDLPPEERQRFIADACEGEPELLELVRTLLARIEVLDDFLEAPLDLPALPIPGLPAVAHPPQGSHLPQVPQLDETVGDWRVLRELGRYGMDAVLLVERGDGDARQTGTLKIARAGAQFGDTVARFHRARQRLSRLDHPAIARPVDAGTTLEGRPYFVMEQGARLPIDQHCAGAGVGLDGRVALVAEACRAVHCAHQHLVIHGDVRPANIVIQANGAPMLLNVGIFGDGNGDGDGNASGAWQPAALFASPEQLAGQPVTTGSDVYSLGAVLYALVSGRSPNAAEAAGIISTLARPAPVKPSEAVSEAFERHYPPLPELATDELLRPSLDLARQLRGDLDDIILKAVDLDPARRYASADALAGDLERFLARAPLAATAPVTERRRSLPRRHPVALAVSALVACSLVAVTVAALWHAREADQARAAAEQRAGRAGAPARSGKPAGKLPAAAAASAASAAATKPAASAASYLQTAAARRAAGDLPAAQQAAATALGLAEKQVTLDADDVRARRELTTARSQLGAILVEQGRTADGLAEMRKALALREDLAAKPAGNPGIDGNGAARDVADAHSALAGAMMATGDYPAAERELALAHATYAAQLRASPADAGLRARLVELQMARATVQNLQHHGRDAVASLTALHALARGAGAGRAPVDAHVSARIALLDAHIQPRGTPAKAYAAAEQALGQLLTQTEKDPADAYQLRESALAWQQTGEIGLRANQGASACGYLALAAKRYAQFEASQRLNAIDKLRQGQVQALRKACG